MKILITGVYGFVGKNLFLKFKDKFKVIGIGRRKKNQKKLKNLIDKKINLKNLLSLDFNPDIILHCAGSGSVTKSYKNKKLDYEKNVNTTKEIIRFIKYLNKKPRLLYFSSAAVYGDHCNKSNKKIKPVSPYGRNKLLSERILLNASKSLDFNLVIMRFYSIYGKGLKKQLVWDACKKIVKGNNNFFGSGEEIRSWINIKDVVSVVEHLLKNKTPKNSILDIYTDDILKNKDLLKILFKIFKFNFNPEFNNKSKKGDPRKQVVDDFNFKNINWKKKVSISDGLKEYVKWFRSQKI